MRNFRAHAGLKKCSFSVAASRFEKATSLVFFSLTFIPYFANLPISAHSILSASLLNSQQMTRSSA
jgi:hypothetical protein